MVHGTKPIWGNPNGNFSAGFFGEWHWQRSDAQRKVIVSHKRWWQF
jgi:hypothetical protein